MRGWICSMAVVGFCAAGVGTQADAKTVTITFDELPMQEFTGIGPKVKGVQFIASSAVHLQVPESPWKPGSGTFGEDEELTNGPALGLQGDDRIYFFVFDEPVTSFYFDIYASAGRYPAPAPDLTPSSSAGILKAFADSEDVFKPIDYDGEWSLSGTPLGTASVILTKQINLPIDPLDNDQRVGLFVRVGYVGSTFGGFSFQQTDPYNFGAWIDNLTYTTADNGNVIPTPAAAGLGLALLAGAATRRRR